MITLNDIIHEQPALLARVDATRRAAEEAKADVAALKAALTDLEDQLLQDALEAKNEAARKAKLAELKRDCPIYQRTSAELREAQGRLRSAEADFEDATLRQKTADKALAALAAQEERLAAEALGAAYQCYARAAVDIRRAAETQLAAKQQGVRT